MLLPTPAPLPLQLHQYFTDPASAYARDLSDANAARARVRSVLKDSRRAGGGGDWAAAVRVTTEYIPYLYAILACVESDDLILKAEPLITWRFSLSTQLLKKDRTKVYYELAAVLLTHALCLSNHSATMVASLGSYETASSVSSSDIKLHDETINAAAELLCRASGVFTHLAEVVIPRWESAVGDGIKGRPVEMGREVSEGLAKLSLADANLLAIRRLMSRSLSLSHTTTTPGPPLPSSHPSPSLLSKLHLNVYTLYDSARSLLKTASLSPTSTGEIVPELRRYLSDGRAIALGLSYKWLGVDAGENGGREKAGESLRWLEMARKELEEVEGKAKGLKGLKIGKGKSAGKERKGKVEGELDAIAAFYGGYKKVNDTVHFQPLPTATTLQAKVPAGRAALSPKPFAPPQPAFKPRSMGDANRPKAIPPPPGSFGMDGLSLEDEDDSDEEDGGEANGYFGAGSYW
ncbi:pH-response regulator protein palc [Pseudohyphozyma bogoriensis]|nr:pH-response regulator protein palc [Pseudohyphozyma bogoriensis]